MTSLGKLLIVMGLALAVVGVLFVVGQKLGLGKLPGDISYRGDKVTFHFPIVTSIVVSVVLTVLLNLFLNRR
jgi:hypothetical protein